VTRSLVPTTTASVPPRVSTVMPATTSTIHHKNNKPGSSPSGSAPDRHVATNGG
jgi:hypothetical protein